MRLILKFITLFSILVSLSQTSYALQSNVSIGPKISTQGFGVEVRTPFAENFFGRVGFNYLPLNINLNI